MSKNTASGFDPTLLDDFFAEADEHLLAIRQCLLRLEAASAKAAPTTEIIERLFHDFHSFKGISAIVGLAPAEALAHGTEDFLRLARREKTQIAPAALEVLMAAAQKLEQIVSAFRAGKSLPECGSLLEDLKRQCQEFTSDPATAAPSSHTESIAKQKREEAIASGLATWKYIYSPSHELTSRGVNIDSIREAIVRSGEILKTTPLIQEGGNVAFEFLVSLRGTPDDLAAWAAKGVTVRLAETAEKPSITAQAPASAGIDDGAHNPFLSPSHVVRVDLKRLDDLMRITGEMVIQRSRLDNQLSQLNGRHDRFDVREIQEVKNRLARSLRELRESVMRIRMVPVSEIFARMPFVVKDLARQSQKSARLKLSGQDTAIDKYLIERLKDPLLHLVRNAFSHGVETREERIAAAKPEQATIELTAASVGETVVIQVIDDGKGIDPQAIAARATQLGVEVPARLDDDMILKILCSSGFSTREDVDRAAGRGVGMAVVLATVKELGGKMSLASEKGRGTRFTLTLPVTLAISETVIVTIGKQTCAVVQNSISELLRVDEKDIQTANGIEVISYRNGVLPIVRLAKLFQLKESKTTGLCLLVILTSRGSFGLLVDKVEGRREVVVRALEDPLIQVRGISGATELGDGKPVLILDVETLAEGQLRPPEQFDIRQQS